MENHTGFVLAFDALKLIFKQRNGKFTRISALLNELVGVFMRELDVVHLVVDNLKTAFHAAHDCVGEHLLSRRPKNAFAQVNIVVVC